MQKKTGKVREIRQSKKVGTMQVPAGPTDFLYPDGSI